MADILSPEEQERFNLDTLACSVAESFIDAFYYALEKNRGDIASFYCPREVSADSTVPFIAWNGATFHDALEFQTYFEGLTHTHYDVESLDCDILNVKALPAAAVKGGSGDESKDLDRRMSVQVMTMGRVRLQEPLKGPNRCFSEKFVLVPNPEKLPSPKPTFVKGWQKEWMIQTHNFRFTELDPTETGEVKDEEMKTNGVSSVSAKNKGIAAQFAAAGLLTRGKVKT